MSDIRSCGGPLSHWAAVAPRCCRPRRVDAVACMTTKFRPLFGNSCASIDLDGAAADGTEIIGGTAKVAKVIEWNVWERRAFIETEGEFPGEFRGSAGVDGIAAVGGGFLSAGNSGMIQAIRHVPWAPRSLRVGHVSLWEACLGL